MRARTALAVMMIIGGVVAAGCIPPTTGGGGGSTTTTTVGSGNPAAGCYDSTQSSASDVLYSGVPNVVGNVHGTASTNGTCSGAVSTADGILVLAGGEPQANADCFALGRSGAYSANSVGLTTMPAHAWFCSDN